jgi:SSS family solute:Na+ symporter
MLLLASIGFALLAYFRANPQAIADGQSLHGEADFLFPHFMTNYLPPGIGGLSLAAILAAAMSSLSSGMNSISTVAFVDFLPRIPRLAGGEQSIRWAKWVTAGIGVFVVLLSLVMDQVPGNLQEVASKTSALFLAPLFILFFMALYVPFATPGGAVLGAFYSFLAAVLWGFWDVITGLPGLSFQWIAMLSLAVGLMAGPLFSFANATVLATPVILVFVGWTMLGNRPSP